MGLSLLLVQFVPGFGFIGKTDPSGSFFQSTIEILQRNMGSDRPLSEFARLLYFNRELKAVAVWRLASRDLLSWSAFLVPLFYFQYFRKKSSSPKKDVLFVFLTFFIILTLFFARSKALVGPLAAMCLGECWLFVKTREAYIKKALIAVLFIVFVVTGYDAFALSNTRGFYTQLRPDFKQILGVINKQTPKNSVILSYWSDGYPIQTYTQRPTITDGLFEEPENVRRIIAVSKIYYSTNLQDLFRFCRKLGVTHLLVPKNRKTVYADYAGLPYQNYYQGNRPTVLGEKTNLHRLMSGFETPELRLLFQNKEYNLYALYDNSNNL